MLVSGSWAVAPKDTSTVNMFDMYWKWQFSYTVHFITACSFHTKWRFCCWSGHRAQDYYSSFGGTLMIKTEKLLIYCFYWWFLTLTWKHFIFYCSALVKTELLLFFNTILTNLLFEARYLLPFQSWAKNSVFKLFLFICLSKSLFSFKYGCTTIFSECVFTQISQMSDKIDIG